MSNQDHLPRQHGRVARLVSAVIFIVAVLFAVICFAVCLIASLVQSGGDSLAPGMGSVLAMGFGGVVIAIAAAVAWEHYRE